jgi:hypothetical protein
MPLVSTRWEQYDVLDLNAGRVFSFLAPETHGNDSSFAFNKLFEIVCFCSSYWFIEMSARILFIIKKS